MSEVKRYDISAFGGMSMDECRDGAYVNYDDYSALEAKCSALAVESARLKKFCKDAAFDADYEAELGMERGGFSDALNDIETTATDAFLAEVRAQGVEMFAECAYTLEHHDHAVAFAAELRKGVDKK